MSHNPFDLLPRDLWCEVFHHCADHIDKMNVMEVCTHFRDILKSEPGIWGSLDLTFIYDDDVEDSPPFENFSTPQLDHNRLHCLRNLAGSDEEADAFMDWLQMRAAQRGFSRVRLCFEHNPALSDPPVAGTWVVNAISEHLLPLFPCPDLTLALAVDCETVGSVFEVLASLPDAAGLNVEYVRGIHAELEPTTSQIRSILDSALRHSIRLTSLEAFCPVPNGESDSVLRDVFSLPKPVPTLRNLTFGLWFTSPRILFDLSYFASFPHVERLEIVGGNFSAPSSSSVGHLLPDLKTIYLKCPCEDHEDATDGISFIGHASLLNVLAQLQSLPSLQKFPTDYSIALPVAIEAYDGTLPLCHSRLSCPELENAPPLPIFRGPGQSGPSNVPLRLVFTFLPPVNAVLTNDVLQSIEAHITGDSRSQTMIDLTLPKSLFLKSRDLSNFSELALKFQFSSQFANLPYLLFSDSGLDFHKIRFHKSLDSCLESLSLLCLGDDTHHRFWHREYHPCMSLHLDFSTLFSKGLPPPSVKVIGQSLRIADIKMR